jgi:hypothetical protein
MYINGFERTPVEEEEEDEDERPQMGGKKSTTLE